MSVADLAMDQESWAMKMLIKSEALTECDRHEGVYIDEGIDSSKIYKYAAVEYKKNNDVHLFESFRDMTDTVKLQYEEHGGNDICPLCFKHIDD